MHRKNQDGSGILDQACKISRTRIWSTIAESMAVLRLLWRRATRHCAYYIHQGCQRNKLRTRKDFLQVDDGLFHDDKNPS